MDIVNKKHNIIVSTRDTTKTKIFLGVSRVQLLCPVMYVAGLEILQRVVFFLYLQHSKLTV